MVTALPAGTEKLPVAIVCVFDFLPFLATPFTVSNSLPVHALEPVHASLA